MQREAGDEPDPEVVDVRLLAGIREGLDHAAAGRVSSHKDVVAAFRRRISGSSGQ